MYLFILWRLTIHEGIERCWRTRLAYTATLLGRHTRKVSVTVGLGRVSLPLQVSSKRGHPVFAPMLRYLRGWYLQHFRNKTRTTYIFSHWIRDNTEVISVCHFTLSKYESWRAYFTFNISRLYIFMANTKHYKFLD